MTVLDLDTGEVAGLVQELDDARRQVKAANERARQMAEDLAYAVKNWSATSAVLWKVQHELDALRNGQPAPAVVTLTDRGVGDGYGVEE